MRQENLFRRGLSSRAPSSADGPDGSQTRSGVSH
jgi:hypothetical protein